MRVLMVISIIAVGFGLALVGREAAYARTPTPTATSTPMPSPTYTPSAQQISTFAGVCWLDAQPCRGEMSARINGVICARDTTPVSVPGVAGLVFHLAVPSKDVLPGCGYEGATVEFFIGNERAALTGIWRTGPFQHMTFIAGHPFAFFVGGLGLVGTVSNEVVVPYVGDKPCGFSYMGPSGYQAIVYSSEQEPGCGTEGAQITFKLLDAEGNVTTSLVPVIAENRALWHAWDGISPPQAVNLMMAPAGGIKIGNVGTGESQRNGTALWKEMALVLAAMGLGGVAVGSALRRRA